MSKKKPKMGQRRKAKMLSINDIKLIKPKVLQFPVTQKVLI